MLYIIGIGLNDEKDISVKGLEAVKKCSEVYLESYTSILQVPTSKLEEFYGKKIIVSNRELVEQKFEKEVLPKCKDTDVVLLVIGDGFSATTHAELARSARKQGIKVQVIGNASVLTAVGMTGLQLYKFGKVTSIPFFAEGHETPYKVFLENKKQGLHTLFLLDLHPEKEEFMTVNDALEILEWQGLDENTLCIGCARLGNENQTIKSGPLKELIKVDFGKAPHCLIIPGNMHFLEEESLKEFS